MRGLGDLVESQGNSVILTLSKDKAEGGEQPFRSMNFVNMTDKIRFEIFRPIYDAPVVLNHHWLSGCSSNTSKKVEFDIEA